MRITLPEPWLSFLKELDPIAGEPTKIPCIGGFAVTQHYGSARTTVGVDMIDACAYVDVSNSSTQKAPLLPGCDSRTLICVRFSETQVQRPSLTQPAQAHNAAVPSWDTVVPSAIWMKR